MSSFVEVFHKDNTHTHTNTNTNTHNTQKLCTGNSIPSQSYHVFKYLQSGIPWHEQQPATTTTTTIPVSCTSCQLSASKIKNQQGIIIFHTLSFRSVLFVYSSKSSSTSSSCSSCSESIFPKEPSSGEGHCG